MSKEKRLVRTDVIGGRSNPIPDYRKVIADETDMSAYPKMTYRGPINYRDYIRSTTLICTLDDDTEISLTTTSPTAVVKIEQYSNIARAKYSNRIASLDVDGDMLDLFTHNIIRVQIVKTVICEGRVIGDIFTMFDTKQLCMGLNFSRITAFPSIKNRIFKLRIVVTGFNPIDSQADLPDEIEAGDIVAEMADDSNISNQDAKNSGEKEKDVKSKKKLKSLKKDN